MCEWERKQNQRKKKENKASWKAHTFLHRGQTWAKETCSRMKQNQFAKTETAWEWKKTKTEDSGASTQGPEYHRLVPSQYKGGGSTIKELKGCCLVVGEKGSIFGFQLWLLLGIYPARMVAYSKEVVDGWNHQMHTIEVAGEVTWSLSIWTQRQRYMARTNKGRFCHGIGSGRKRMHWVYPIVVVVGQPMGWWVVLKGCSQRTKSSW